jgi:hypothetical protein
MEATAEQKELVLALARAKKKGPEIEKATGLSRNQIAGIRFRDRVKNGHGKNRAKTATPQAKLVQPSKPRVIQQTSNSLWELLFPLDRLPQEGQCKWPIGGNTKDNPIRFVCTGNRAGGESYCAVHAKASVNPYTKRAA